MLFFNEWANAKKYSSLLLCEHYIVLMTNHNLQFIFLTAPILKQRQSRQTGNESVDLN